MPIWNSSSSSILNGNDENERNDNDDDTEATLSDVEQNSERNGIVEVHMNLDENPGDVDLDQLDLNPE